MLEADYWNMHKLKYSTQFEPIYNTAPVRFL